VLFFFEERKLGGDVPIYGTVAHAGGRAGEARCFSEEKKGGNEGGGYAPGGRRGGLGVGMSDEVRGVGGKEKPLPLSLRKKGEKETTLFKKKGPEQFVWGENGRGPRVEQWEGAGKTARHLFLKRGKTRPEKRGM